jgi:hypothetical protein
VLQTPSDPRHRQYLADTMAAGPVAVHIARARGGLLVGSVIAADASVPAGKVLAEAGKIVTAEARQQGSIEHLSLFELPLGPAPVWTITEEPHTRPGRFDREERFTSVLPAWSARSKVDLTCAGYAPSRHDPIRPSLRRRGRDLQRPTPTIDQRLARPTRILRLDRHARTSRRQVGRSLKTQK